MKTKLLLLIVCITVINTIIFSVVSGCGIFQAIPMILGWNLVALVRNPLFADHHAHIVAAAGALISALFLTGFLMLIVLVERKRGLTESQLSLNKLFIIGGVIYIVLSAVPIPFGPCF